jgi:glycerol uptake facilitator-like aquaporin
MRKGQNRKSRPQACFSTAPAVRLPAANVMTEAIATAMLVLDVAAIFSKAALPSGPRPA